MNYQEYQQLFEAILASKHLFPPYNDSNYFNYTKLNRSRMNRWDKLAQLDEQLVVQVKSIRTTQHWVIISEPWCGDAAHVIPFLIKLAAVNALISYDIQLRDQPPFLIDLYLTNGSKSIPKLIVRNESGQDLFYWGPRPAGAQQLINQFKAANADFEATKIALQNWYNEDKGAELMQELSNLLLLRNG